MQTSVRCCGLLRGAWNWLVPEELCHLLPSLLGTALVERSWEGQERAAFVLSIKQ